MVVVPALVVLLLVVWAALQQPPATAAGVGWDVCGLVIRCCGGVAVVWPLRASEA